MKDIQIAVSAWFIVTFCPQLLFYGIAAIIPCSEKVAATGIPGGAMFPEHTVVSRGEREGSHPPPWPSLCCEPHHSILHVAFQPPGPCAQPLPQPCPASLSPPAPMWNSSRRLTWSRKKAGWQDGVHVSDLFIFLSLNALALRLLHISWKWNRWAYEVWLKNTVAALMSWMDSDHTSLLVQQLSIK